MEAPSHPVALVLLLLFVTFSFSVGTLVLMVALTS